MRMRPLHPLKGHPFGIILPYRDATTRNKRQLAIKDKSQQLTTAGAPTCCELAIKGKNLIQILELVIAQ